jgi:DNA-binding MarR family transcriptional regulator
MSQRQLVLKPQDFLVAIKLAVNIRRDFLLATLGQELGMVISAVHGCVRRCEQARLVSRSSGEMRAVRSSILEFALHGARYAFPAIQGTLTRGMATSIAGPSLRDHFDQNKALPPVWPDSSGDAYGPSITALHHTVPMASRQDEKLFDVLTLIDALRIGAAREREMAAEILKERLS